MTDQHPITPPPELVEDWIELAKPLPQRPPNPGELAALAARWGADQELEACCEWLDRNSHVIDGFHLRIDRRPKPPSLKELALANTNAILNDPNRALLTEVRETLELNRRALEQLDG